MIGDAPSKQIWVPKAMVEAQKGRKSIWIPKKDNSSPTTGKNQKNARQIKEPTTRSKQTKTRQIWVPKRISQAQKTQKYIWIPIKSLQKELPNEKREGLPKVIWIWQPKPEIIVPEITDAFTTLPVKQLKQYISDSVVMQ